MRNFTILAVLSSLFFVTPVFAAFEISDGSIKSLYHLEDEVDSSGNGYNFTQSGGSFSEGKLGDAFDSDSTGYLSASSSAWDMSDDYTIGFWLKINSGSRDFGWLGRKVAGGGNMPDGFGSGALCTTAGNVEFFHNKSGATCQVDTAQSLNTGQWYYFLVTGFTCTNCSKPVF